MTETIPLFRDFAAVTCFNPNFSHNTFGCFSLISVIAETFPFFICTARPSGGIIARKQTARPYLFWYSHWLGASRDHTVRPQSRIHMPLNAYSSSWAVSRYTRRAKDYCKHAPAAAEHAAMARDWNNRQKLMTEWFNTQKWNSFINPILISCVKCKTSKWLDYACVKGS